MMTAQESEYFIREVDYTKGTLSINQATIGDVGYVVWDAALVLSKFIDNQYFQKEYSLIGKNVLELGAGTGLVGMVASMHSSTVHITDLEDLVPLMRKNITENQLEDIEACTLKWGEANENLFPDLDYIFMADCIYYDQSLHPLINTLKQLCCHKTRIFLSYEERDTDHKIRLLKDFFQLVSQDFNVTQVPRKYHDPLYNSEDIHIYQLVMK